MARRRRKKILQTGNDFLKLSIAIALVAALAFYLKDRSPASRPPTPPPVEKAVKTESKKAESLPSEKRVQKSRALSGLLPEQAWQDDYLVLKTSLGKSSSELYLIGMGIVPEGKNPEKIQDPSKLKPRLIVAKKEGEDFVQVASFDFDTNGTSAGGLQSKNLKGIPRIKSSDLLDLEGNGMPEIQVGFDTVTDLAQAVGFLRWDGSDLRWVKARDKNGEEKAALWIIGSTSADSQQIEAKKGEKGYEIVQKYGQADPQHPEKGFEWKTTIWKMKNGVLIAQ